MQVVVVPPCLALSLRPTVGRFLHCQICLDSLAVTDLSISEYLKFKERLASAPLNGRVQGGIHACCNRQRLKNDELQFLVL